MYWLSAVSMGTNDFRIKGHLKDGSYDFLEAFFVMKFVPRTNKINVNLKFYKSFKST